jgi:ligand-binding sensor domain-containing protein/serine phosphatase RsbU (regulator of sigma subunit)
MSISKIIEKTKFLDTLKHQRPIVFGISLLFLFCSIYLSYAQQQRFRFDRISLNEGLSQSIIHTMIKDRDGFLWIGTESGLNKYDGYEFTVYKQNPFDLNSISNSQIISLYEDRNGLLWIGTAGGGLNSFDREIDTFTHYRHIPEDSTSLANDFVGFISGDSEGNVWVITAAGGIDRLNTETGLFRRYRYDPENPNSLNHNGIRSFFEDNSGTIWLGTLSGLNRYDWEGDQFISYKPHKNSSNSLSYDEVTYIHESPTEPGVLWICTGELDGFSEGGGLNRFDINNESFTHYNLQSKKSLSRSGNITGQILEDHEGLFWICSTQGLVCFDRKTEKFNYYLPFPTHSNSIRNVVTSTTEDVSGNFWITTLARDGIYYFDRQNKEFVHIENIPNNPTSLSNNFVQNVLQDPTGVIWIGTNTGGLNKLDQYAKKFQTFTHDPNNPNSLSQSLVRSICEDHQGQLWVGLGGGGLNKLDPERHSIAHYSSNQAHPTRLSNDGVFALYEDSFGDLWIGTFGGGLDRFDKERTKIKNYHNILNDLTSLSGNRVRAIFEDKSGTLWIGTDDGGLNRYNRESDNFTRFTFNADTPNSISHNSVRAIVQDPTGVLWFGTFGGGLNKLVLKSEVGKGKTEVFKPGTPFFTHYQHNPENPASLSQNSIQSIYVDGQGILWIGTFGGGLNRFDPETEKFEHFTEQNSDLPNNVIYGVLGDDSGNIWTSSNRGLSRFDPLTRTFSNYDVDDGLQSKEFNGQACFKSSSGEMFFGGIDGLNAFYPDSIRDNPFVPDIAITDFRLFGESVPIGNYSPLKKHITETETIQLAYWQNDISFDYVALHYNRPSENKYSYILVNYDEGWREVGKKRTATYTSLEPGDYYFRVRGCNNDGVWNKKGATVRIIITPPWWETKWAYIGYVVGGLILILIVYWLMHNYLVNRERGRSRIREAELRAQAAEARERAVQAENERKTLELDEARKLQLSMLPKNLPQVPNLEIAVHMQTAAEVGGDYYDFYVDEKDRLTVVIGDATGHGLKAGTMVSVIKSLFVANVSHSNIQSFFADCTKTIKKLQLGNLYMALTLLKIENSELVFSSAGMPPIYVFRKKTNQVEEITIKGMPLGAFDDFVYYDKRVKLNQGDTIFLLSDGLPELFNEEKEMFDYFRIKDSFEKVAHKSPQSIIDHFVQVSDEWKQGGSLNDDMTFVVLKIKN